MPSRRYCHTSHGWSFPDSVMKPQAIAIDADNPSGWRRNCAGSLSKSKIWGRGYATVIENRRPSAPWLALAVLALGLFMTPLDRAIVNAASPSTLHRLHPSLD